MVKKNKQKTQSLPAQPAGPAEPILSRRGKIAIAAGICAVAAGFYLLTLTDPAGRNWASNLCPFVILGGYATIGVGIILPDPGESKEPEAGSEGPGT